MIFFNATDDIFIFILIWQIVDMKDFRSKNRLETTTERNALKIKFYLHNNI